MSYCLDVESFINEVKKHPEIWDLNSEDNRHKNRKQKAWSEIAKVFIQDFDSMLDIDRQELYRKLHSKWRNIRDSFVRHIKKKDGKRGYMYAHHLSFLNNIYKQGGSDMEDQNESWDSEDAAKLTTLTRKRTYEEPWSSDVEEDVKKKKDNAIEYVETFDGPSSFVEDGDRSFFDSVMPAVREFTMDQKLEFRSEVLRVIKRIRSGNMKTEIHATEYD